MSFFGFLTGASARKDLQGSYADSKGMLDSAYKDASEIGNKYYGEAQNYLSPYLQGGKDADAQIRAALGLDGRDAQSGYFQNFQTDPGFQTSVNYGINALDRSAAARGGMYSGAHMKALQDYGQRRMGEAYDTRINQLMGYGQQGRAMAGTAAGLAQQHGSDMAGMRYGYGQQSAANRINIGNALAANRGTFMNNMLKVGEVAAKAYATSDRRVKRDIEQIGALASGLPVYSFRYLWDDAPQIGVMAQEARDIFPDAVIETPGGVLMVDYSLIG